MHYLIYQITNTKNGKIYIGCHKTENANDGYLGSGRNVMAAVKKYGKESFIKDILHDFATPEEMFAKEKELVTEEFVRRKDTYNMAVGGYGGLRVNPAEQSERLRNYFKIAGSKEKTSAATKQAMSRPEVKLNMSLAQRARFQRPDEKDANRERQRVRFQHPTEVEASRERARTLWQTETYQQKQIKSHRNMSVEGRMNIANAMKEKWKDPVYRQYQMERRKRANA